MALKVWVAELAPAVMAATASAALAWVWAERDADAGLGGVADEVGCAGKLGREGEEADVSAGGLLEAVEEGG